eukprot:TRINITY_DN85_c0_g1_i1.p1 TRINITY_DN85_c0_g1~~TRINITY_DN85_c0_g1_i1.p1  ORF type:complete len:180 (-),score=42.21 TRINITY_DN85_c0_g1_i1:107-646(-)
MADQQVHHEQSQVTVTTQGEPAHQETVVHVEHTEKKKKEKKEGSAGTSTPNKSLNKEELGLFIICIVTFCYSVVTWAVLVFWALVWVRGWVVTAACILGSLGAWNVFRPVTLFFCMIATIVAAALAIVDLVAGLATWIPAGFASYWIPIVVFVAVAFVLYFLLFLFAFRLRGRSFAWIK